MGTYILEAHPDLSEANKIKVNALIKEFMGGDNKKANALAKAYLEKNGGDQKLLLTNDPNLLEPGNQKLLHLRHGQVTVSQRLENNNILERGFQQKASNPNVIYVNPENVDHKPLLNILIHEIGHFKWPGLGPESDHTPLFYRLLRDNLKSFGIEPDPEKDLNGHPDCELNSIKLDVAAIKYRRNENDPIPSPKPDEKCQALIKARALRKKIGQNEGLRYLHTPKVVSINPSVNLTPMGGAVVPVPYTVVGYFDESVNTTKSVRFTSDQVFTMTSFVREVHGDAPGSAGGIKSGTVSATAEPIEHSVNVRAERFHIVRHDDLFYMNNRNTIGRAIFIVGTGEQGNTA